MVGADGHRAGTCSTTGRLGDLQIASAGCWWQPRSIRPGVIALRQGEARRRLVNLRRSAAGDVGRASPARVNGRRRTRPMLIVIPLTPAPVRWNVTVGEPDAPANRSAPIGETTRLAIRGRAITSVWSTTETS